MLVTFLTRASDKVGVTFFPVGINGEEIYLLVFPIENKRMSFDSALLFLKIETLITKQ